MTLGGTDSTRVDLRFERIQSQSESLVITAKSLVASGHTIFDLGVARAINRRVELNLSLDNLTNRDYYETQNYFESRVAPDAARIYGTPGYPFTAIAGMTMRFGRK